MDDVTYRRTAAQLCEAIRARAPECESLRRLPDETLDSYRRSGLLRGLQPRHWGGLELDPLTFFAAVAEVAAACPSSAWFLSVVGVHGWQLALFPAEAQHDVWSEDAHALISSSYAPTGRVERVDGGFRLSGRWSFSSGCDHCQWVFLGGAAPSDDPVPDLRTFLLPRSDYRIIDNWHVAGLAGTGSKDILVEGAFVPEHRTHRFLDAYMLQNPGQVVNPGPLYRLPFGCLFAFAIAVPAIGAARGALDAYRSYMQAKIAAYDGSKVADDPFAQRRLSEAAVEIAAADADVQNTWTALWALATAGEHVPLAVRARARWSAANIVLRGVRAVDLLFEASGGRALFLDNPMQRYFRDVHAMRAHALNNPDRAAQVFGYSELHPGGAPSEFFL
jgi:3-hydroxy-9,10-secoandrosta-1,3,5(10)-triene-9,17-dione monooxygenase